MEIEKVHFNGSEESVIRERMVRLFDGSFDPAWEVAMNITDVDTRRKHYAVLSYLEKDRANGFCFEESEPLVSEPQTSIKDLGKSVMAATTLLVSNFKETIQRFVADEPQR